MTIISSGGSPDMIILISYTKDYPYIDLQLLKTMKMKNVLMILLSCFVFSGAVMAQQLGDLDFVSPMHEDLAAVKKGDQWGFINTMGVLVIDFRDDLVTTADMDYPFFSNGRCLIKENKEGIDHFGFIDTQGTMVIAPEFLNATPFKDNLAIVIKVYKETLGRNELLDKNVIVHRYNEEVIDPSGRGIAHLYGPFNLLYTKEKLKNPPKIQSHFIHSDLVVVPQENGRWEVKLIQ